VESRLLLDIVVCESPAILELLSRKDETLLVGRDAFLVLDLRLYIVDSITGLNLESDRLACESFDKHLHFTIKLEFVFSKSIINKTSLVSRQPPPDLSTYSQF